MDSAPCKHLAVFAFLALLAPVTPLDAQPRSIAVVSFHLGNHGDDKRRDVRALIPPILEDLGYPLHDAAPEDHQVTANILVELEGPGHLEILRQRLTSNDDFQSALDYLRQTYGGAQHRVLLKSTRVPLGQQMRARRLGVWRAYTPLDGLPGTRITSIVQGPDRRLWLGSLDAGLFRFDSSFFESIPGLSQSIRALSVSPSGMIAAGVDSGVVTVDPVTLSLRHYRLQAKVLAIAAVGSDLWVGTEGQGVQRLTLDSGAWNVVPEMPAQTVRDLATGADGVVWAAADEGVGRYRPDVGWTFWSRDEHLPDTRFLTILPDTLERVWIGTDDLGLVLFDAAGEEVIARRAGRQLGGNRVYDLVKTRSHDVWAAAGGRIARIIPRNRGFRAERILQRDGPPGLDARALATDDEGHVWIASEDHGLVRFSGREWRRIGLNSAALAPVVHDLIQAPNGVYWVATRNGVLRYTPGRRPRAWSRLSAEHGLPANLVRDIACDSTGVLWFGTRAGLSRYDGSTITNLTEASFGHPVSVMSLHVDRNGHLLVGTLSGLLMRRDASTGKWSEVRITQGSGISDIAEDPAGRLWFGTQHGAWRFDPSLDTESDLVSTFPSQPLWTRFTESQGLADRRVSAIAFGAEGSVWLGHHFDGVSVLRSDGAADRYSSRNGLSGNRIQTLASDAEGRIWIGTQRDGITLTDGTVFQQFRLKDGLLADTVNRFMTDVKGVFWVATANGIALHEAPAHRTPPTVLIRAASTSDGPSGQDGRISMSTQTPFVTVDLGAISYKTRPEAVVYRYRLVGLDSAWVTTHDPQVEFRALPLGDYRFDVQAVDRDLSYSDVVSLDVNVHPPYGDIVLKGAFCVSLVALAFVSTFAYRRRQEQFAHMRKELETAHDLQMGLMPTEAPALDHLDVAGRCLPAGHVGGDFYQFYRRNGSIAVAIADVTGHAMGAAIPGAMFSGVLKSRMERGGSLEEAFQDLNATLHGSLSGHTLICLAVGEFDLSGNDVRVCDSGCPYPLHYRADQSRVVEIESDGFPLGATSDPVYRATGSRIGEGDYVVFCSDGVVETRDETGRRLGFDRTSAIVERICGQGLPAGGVVEAILAEVSAFKGRSEQLDDVTCVVVRRRPGGARG